jgi:hypothetical protein
MYMLYKYSKLAMTSSSFTVGPVGIPTVGTAAYRLIVPPCFRVSLVCARRAPRTDVARDL